MHQDAAAGFVEVVTTPTLTAAAVDLNRDGTPEFEAAVHGTFTVHVSRAEETSRAGEVVLVIRWDVARFLQEAREQKRVGKRVAAHIGKRVKERVAKRRESGGPGGKAGSIPAGRKTPLPAGRPGRNRGIK